MTTTARILTMAGVCAAMGCLACAGSAKVAPAHEKEEVVIKAAAPEVAVVEVDNHDDRDTTNIVINEDGETIRIEKIDGRVVKVIVNGKELKPGEYDLEGGTYSMDGRKFKLDFDFDVKAPEAPEPPRAPAAPRPMIGVSIGRVGSAMAAQLGVDPGKVTLITDVNEGLPAAKAGVKRFDVVVKVNGKEATQQALIESIRSTKPGKKVELVILRNGEKQEIALAPAFQREERAEAELRERVLRENLRALGRDQNDERERLERTLTRFQRQARDIQREAMRGAEEAERVIVREIGPMLEELLSEENLQAILGEVQREVERALAKVDVQIDGEMRQAIEQAMQSARQALQNIEVEIDMPEVEFFGRNGGAVFVPSPPQAPRIRAEQLHERARNHDLEGRLDRMEERMARLERLLERLVESREGSRN